MWQKNCIPSKQLTPIYSDILLTGNKDMDKRMIGLGL